MRFLYRDIWGKKHGDFNPLQLGYSSGDYFEQNLERVRQSESLDLVFAPKCAFTDRVVELGKDDKEINGWLVRTNQFADGGVVTEPLHAVAILNADCPVVALFDVDAPRLAVMHAGFRCLVPDNRKQRSIIRAAFDDHGFDPKTVKAFVGYGIGPCCYGAEHVPEVRDPMMGTDLPVGRATRGPRAGKRSIDLSQLAINQLLKIGVFEDNIVRELACTSCAKEQIDDAVEFAFHSNVRKDQGRNATLLWFGERGDQSLEEIFGKTRSPLD